MRPAGPVRITGSGGSLAIEDPGDAVHVDTRRTSVDVMLARAVPLTILTTDEPLRLRLGEKPSFQLDAIATDGGTISAESLGVVPERIDEETRVRHTVNSGSVPRGAPKSARRDCDQRSASDRLRVSSKPSSMSAVVLRNESLRPHARAARQSPRRVRSRRPPAHRRHRSHLRVRLRARIGHSRQGQSAHAALGVLVRSSRRRRAASLRRGRRRFVSGRHARRTATCCAAARCSCGRPSRCRSSAWRADISRARAGRTTGERAPSAAFRCRPACGNRTGCRSRSSRRRPRPKSGHDENISEARAGDIVGATLIARLRDLTLELYERGVEHADEHGIIIADTKFEFGTGRRHADPHRRSADARLVALLAEGSSTRPAGLSRASTSSSCATISKRSAGTSSRPCRRCPMTWSPQTREKYLEAYRRLTGRELRT